MTERCEICDRDLPTDGNLPSPRHHINCTCAVCILVCRAYGGALCLHAAPNNWRRRALAAEILVETLLSVQHDKDNIGPTMDFVRIAQTLVTTQDPQERNQAALKVADYQGGVAAHMLFTAYVDLRTRGSRGTLVYALQGFDCTDYVPELIESVVDGSYEEEEALGARTILEKMGDFEMEQELYDELMYRLRATAEGADADRAEVARDCIAAISDGTALPQFYGLIRNGRGLPQKSARPRRGAPV